MGIAAAPEEVLTSAGAAAAVLAERLPAGTPVLVVGAPALHAEIAAAGLEPVRSADEGPRRGGAGLRAAGGLGAACRGMCGDPCGRLVGGHEHRPHPAHPARAIAGQRFAGGGSCYRAGPGPDSWWASRAGRCSPPRRRRSGAQRPLVVGDRLDTDIAGASRAGMDSLLVLTGVSTADVAAAAAEELRPTYVAADLAGLFTSAVTSAR